jgi:hypothetical protein
MIHAVREGFPRFPVPKSGKWKNFPLFCLKSSLKGKKIPSKKWPRKLRDIDSRQLIIDVLEIIVPIFTARQRVSFLSLVAFLLIILGVISSFE